MKALSIDMEYICDIIDGKKTEEYRSWSTKHRGPLLICATAISNIAKKGFAQLVVDVTDCKPMADGGFAWAIENPRFVKPFFIKGQQRLFEVDDGLIDYGEWNASNCNVNPDAFWRYWDAISDKFYDEISQVKKAA